MYLYFNMWKQGDAMAYCTDWNWSQNVCVYDTAAQIMGSSLLNWLDDGTQWYTEHTSSFLTWRRKQSLNQVKEIFYKKGI